MLPILANSTNQAKIGEIRDESQEAIKILTEFDPKVKNPPSGEVIQSSVGILTTVEELSEANERVRETI